MTSCAILGASGHGKVIAEIAELNGFQKIDFYDDTTSGAQKVEHWNIVGDTNSLIVNIGQYDLVAVAIGDNSIRLQKYQVLKNKGAKLGVLTHPKATISKYAFISAGTVVMANANVGPFVKIGEACIVNSSASIDHDCIVSAGVHVSPRACLAGNVQVDSLAWVGAGATIIQGISIGAKSIVGAGAAVIDNVPKMTLSVGIPAKSAKRIN